MNECICCKIAGGSGEGYQKLVVELEGGWVLNHYFTEGGTFLGRLVIVTKAHRVDWGYLSSEELKTLGINIQRINNSLRQYWAINYPEDQIELVHVAYLNESPYIECKIEEELLQSLHVHLHLLTRTKAIRENLNCCIKQIGWHLEDELLKFPKYLKVNNREDVEVIKLMNHLKSCLE